MDEHLRALRFYRLIKEVLKSYHPAFIKLTLDEDGDIEATLVMKEDDGNT